MIKPPLLAALFFINLSAHAADPSSIKRAPERESVIKCLPLDIKPSDSIVINMPPKHGPTLAILTPGGEYYFLAFTQLDPTSTLRAPLDAKSFDAATEVTLKVNSTKGIPWSGRDTIEAPIFVKSGEYIVLVAPTLETEDPVLDGWCKLRYLK